jgi:hypothetical protein
VRLSLLPVSFLAWVIGVADANTTTLGGYGLPANLPALFYAGLILLIISAGIELARKELSPLRVALHAGLLVLMLYGTAAVVYAEPRYGWFYKTAGVVQYIKVNGHLTAGIDIYQSWPGFFALAAWFDRVAGVSTPVDYGNWAQLVFELAALPLLYSIYTSLGLTPRQRWLGLLLYSAGNWIAQDYFSPQALATVLSLGIMAFVLRWMPARDSVVAPNQGQGQEAEIPAGGDGRPRHGHRRAPRREGKLGNSEIPLMTALMLLVFVLVFTHELSPYIITAQLAVLALLKQIRPRWIPLAVAAITIGYLLPNFSYVDNHYGLLSSFGNFFGNVQSPSSLNSGIVPESQHIIADSADLLSAMIWLLALAGAWLMRQSRRRAIALLLLTFSPIVVLFGGAYGNEGILRVYLFSLPWAVALAVTALTPFRPADLIPARLLREARKYSLGRIVCGPRKPGWLGPIDVGTLVPPVALALAAALFLPAFYGNDEMNVYQPSEVATTSAFLQAAKPGMVLCALDNATLAFTAKYNQFPLGVIFGQYGVIESDPAKMDIASYLARTVVNYTNGLSPGYVLITPSMEAENADYGYIPEDYLTDLANSMRASKYWKPIYNDDGTVVYEITSAANDIPTGPYNTNPLVSVP